MTNRNYLQGNASARPRRWLLRICRLLQHDGEARRRTCHARVLSSVYHKAACRELSRQTFGPDHIAQLTALRCSWTHLLIGAPAHLILTTSVTVVTNITEWVEDVVLWGRIRKCDSHLAPRGNNAHQVGHAGGGFIKYLLFHPQKQAKILVEI